MPAPSPRISRRAVLAGAAGAAGVALLAACGSSGGDDDTADGSGDDGGSGGAGFNLSAIFPPDGLLVAGTAQRLPFTLSDATGVPVDEPPAS
ncbi:MAG: hypothetical protein KDB10_04705, partial [Acidimicrobiales bacterium]|nr:hypothetical protein [Acidimicrobiales bacterium]